MQRILILTLAFAASLSAAVHGWTCDETTWTSQVPALSKDCRVITLDLPGHGKTGSPKSGKLLQTKILEMMLAPLESTSLLIGFLSKSKY